MFYVSGINGQQTPFPYDIPRVSADRPVIGISPINPIAPALQTRGQANVESESAHVRHNPYQKLDQEQPKRERALVAYQIMSTPITALYSNESMRAAWELFHQKRFRHVPVVNKAKRLVGIVSDRDFIALGLKHLAAAPEERKILEQAIEKFMTTNVLTARPGTEIRLLARIMFNERIGALPIVDENGELVGMVTRSDILRTVINQAPLELWT